MSRLTIYESLGLRVRVYNAEDTEKFQDVFDQILAAEVKTSPTVDPYFNAKTVWVHRGDLKFIENVHETPLWYYKYAWSFYRCQRIKNSDTFKVLDEVISIRGIIKDFLKVSVETITTVGYETSTFFNLSEVPMVTGDKDFPRYPIYADKCTRLKMMPYGEVPDMNDSSFVPDKSNIIKLFTRDIKKVKF